MDQEIPRSPGDGSRRVDLHPAQLSPGVDGVPSLASAGTTATTALGNLEARRLPQLCPFSWPGQFGSRRHSTPLLGAAFVLQVSDPARRLGSVTHQKPFVAKDRKATAEIPDGAADG